MEALELLNNGELDQAIASAIAEVRSSPTQTGFREILAELLCLSGDLERADKQAETIVTQDPQSSTTVALLRQLIRAETCRVECWEQGRVPEFIGEPDALSKKRLKALIGQRSGQLNQVSELLNEISSARSKPRGTCDGLEFDDLVDMDDFCVGMFELLTSTGKYFWIPVDRIKRICFEPLKRPKDLMWRQCDIEVTDGPNGVVYIPVLYPGTDRSVNGPERLGRTTDWIEVTEGIFAGRGQRTFEIGDRELGLLELTEVKFGIES